MRQEGISGEEASLSRDDRLESPRTRSRRTCSNETSTSSSDTAWVTDVTYVWTHEGWLYLAAILDLFSRRVVGWAAARTTIAPRPQRSRTGVRGERPSEGLIHHSDRGSVYASADYGDALKLGAEEHEPQGRLLG